MADASKVNSFIQITASSEEKAKEYLSKYGQDLERAINSFFEDSQKNVQKIPNSRQPITNPSFGNTRTPITNIQSNPRSHARPTQPSTTRSPVSNAPRTATRTNPSTVTPSAEKPMTFKEKKEKEQLTKRKCQNVGLLPGVYVKDSMMPLQYYSYSIILFINS